MIVEKCFAVHMLSEQHSCLFFQLTVLVDTTHQYLYLFSVCCIVSVCLCLGTLEMGFYMYKSSLERWQWSPRESITLCAAEWWWLGERWIKVSSTALCFVWFEITNCTLDESGLIKIFFLISSTTKTNTFENYSKVLNSSVLMVLFSEVLGSHIP